MTWLPSKTSRESSESQSTAAPLKVLKDCRFPCRHAVSVVVPRDHPAVARPTANEDRGPPTAVPGTGAPATRGSNRADPENPATTPGAPTTRDSNHATPASPATTPGTPTTQELQDGSQENPEPETVERMTCPLNLNGPEMHRLPRVPQGGVPKRRTRERELQSEKANGAVNAIAIGTNRTTRTPEPAARVLAGKMGSRPSWTLEKPVLSQGESPP